MVRKRIFIFATTFVYCVYNIFASSSQAGEVIYDSPDDLAQTEPSAGSNKNQKEQQKPQKAPLTLEESQKKFKALKKEIDSGTNNLDVYFEYAQIATSLGKNKEAIFAYSHMLKADPSLQRVKLELALAKMRTGKLKQARSLFQEVLRTNPPDAVKANIKSALKIVEQGLKTDIFSGSVTTGYNIDTNSNSASATGRTTFVDNDIPLSPGSTSQRDGQAYVSASLSHIHKFDSNKTFYKVSLESLGVFYKTRQDTQSAQDITLYSFKTGPSLTFPDHGTKLSLTGSVSMIELNSRRYLRSRSLDFAVTKSFGNNIIVNASYTHEYRNFLNNINSSTFSDRTGTANQQNLGLTYALTQKDIFNVAFSWRSEDAKNDVYGTTQRSVTGSYTRMLPWGLSFNSLLGFKITNYHQPDPLVSATALRHDKERSMTYTLTKKLPRNMNLSTAYQYKNVASNVQNNDYYNHRYSASLGWSF